MSTTTSSTYRRTAWKARAALATVSLFAALAACTSSLDSPDNQQDEPASQVELDENEPDEVEPDENQRNENEVGENERDENEPDDTEPDENEPDDTEEGGSDD